jgi:hypothetical protein
LKLFVTVAPHRRYPNFDVVVGLAWSYDSESCAGVSDALVMVLLARQDKWPTVEPEYNIGLLAVQEVRWLGRSMVEKDCTVYYR